jgi:hypothetical protein
MQKKYLNYVYQQENLTSHALKAVKDCHKGDQETYTIHTNFPGDVPASIIVTPSKSGGAALLSWFMWDKPAGWGRISLRTWRWSGITNTNMVTSPEKLEFLSNNTARLWV